MRPLSWNGALTTYVTPTTVVFTNNGLPFCSFDNNSEARICARCVTMSEFICDFEEPLPGRILRWKAADGGIMVRYCHGVVNSRRGRSSADGPLDTNAKNLWMTPCRCLMDAYWRGWTSNRRNGGQHARRRHRSACDARQMWTVTPRPGGMVFKMEETPDLPPASVIMPLTVVVMSSRRRGPTCFRSGSSCTIENMQERRPTEPLISKHTHTSVLPLGQPAKRAREGIDV